MPEDVIVVGLGAMGAAALYQLARRGIAAHGIDRFTPPHTMGSSHGETRITRQAVGEGADYVPLVLRSHEIWRELEAATGRTLMIACGGMMMGPRHTTALHHGRPDFLPSTMALATRFGIVHTVFDRAGLAARFPQFTGLTDDDVGYFEPGAGILHPEACISAQLEEAQRLGARITTGSIVHAITQEGTRVRLETDAGPLTAEHVIIAAGAWTAPLLGAPFDRRLTVTRQMLHWFAVEDPTPLAPGRLPIFIRLHGQTDEDVFYGFPITDGATDIKVATERYHEVVTADGVDRSVDPAAGLAVFDRHVAGRLAGVARHVTRSAACLYTSTADGGFLIDTHPSMSAVTVISACSGHGFKHSAGIGEAVAQQVVEGRSEIDLGAFGLA